MSLVSHLALEEEDICIDVFLMLHIPMVIRCSFLLLSLASLIPVVLMHFFLFLLAGMVILAETTRGIHTYTSIREHI